MEKKGQNFISEKCLSPCGIFYDKFYQVYVFVHIVYFTMKKMIILKLALDFMCPSSVYEVQLVNKGSRAYVAMGSKRLISLHTGKLQDLAKTTFPVKGKLLLNLQAAIDKECIICQKPFQGGFDSTFGDFGHPACVRDQLINTYFINKYGVDDNYLFEELGMWSSEYGGYSGGVLFLSRRLEERARVFRGGRCYWNVIMWSRNETCFYCLKRS